MKKSTLILFVALLACADSFGLTSDFNGPFLQEGKKWSYEGIDSKRNIHYIDYTLNGDTTINEQTYYKLNRFHRNNKTSTYHSAWREDDSRIYMLQSGKQEEILVFDFDINIGEMMESQPGVILKALDEVKTTHDYVDYTFKRLFFSDESATVQGYIIQGIGSINGLLNSSFSAGYNGLDGFSENFDNCSINGTTIFDCDDRVRFLEVENINPNSHSFLKEGKVWNCLLKERAEVQYGDVLAIYSQESVYGLRIGGDTIVEGMTYKRMYKDLDYRERTLLYSIPKDANGLEHFERVEGGTTLCPELWREEGGKVYLRWSANEEEVLQYDFSLASGESALIGGGIPTTCVDIDTIFVQNRYLRRCYMTLYDMNDSFRRVWVEGIGHPAGPMQVWGAEVNDGSTHTLLSVYEDGECIFTQEDFNAPSSSTTDAISMAQQPVARQQSSFCDLQGRRLRGQPRRGLYIQDGQKKVVSGR